ncbi:Ig-like domain repeat protein [Aeromicrobium sp. 9AM]|uniref:Ig-like domain repeat protein n=1 Tax=Aeromicrobium sp. 9AM TaxID=2653126 RepID=UPI001358C3B7|nr:Ig-like domain repeat protein [Aeromicrobium sp. 9AM]
MILALLPGVIVMSPGQAADGPPTVVSLTFDDGSTTQLLAAGLMTNHGMPGTFYVNSGNVGKNGYATRAELTQLAADGHEIGGHTLHHANLTTLPSTEAKRQICLDRANLTEWGFTVRSFAFPFAEGSTAIGDLVRDCGYNSARNVGDMRSRFGCDDCTYTESTPPGQPYSLKAHDVVNEWTLQDLQDAVTNAESSGGGWVPLTFHNFCEDVCGALSTDTALFEQFLTWLEPRAASNNTVVKTVGDVVGGVAQPVVSVDDVPTQDESGVNNPSLESIAPSGLPACWQAGTQGAITAAVDTVAPGRTGQVAGRVTVSSFTSGDAKLVITRDLGTCAPAVTPGKAYVLRGWYTSTAQTQFVVHRRNAAGTWSYWTSSPFFGPSSTYAPATWTTGQVPPGTTGISFGLNLVAVGTLTVDDFTLSATDSVPRTIAAVAPTAPDGTAGWYRTRPEVTLSVDRGSPAATTEYSVDDGATWHAYTGPFDAPDSYTLSYRSKFGTIVEPTRTIDLKVDTTAPSMAPALDPSNRTLNVNAADNGSGIALVEKRDVGSSDWTPVTGPEVLGDDAAHLDLRATDHAGHESTKTVHVLARAEAGVSLSLGSSLTYGKGNTATVAVTAPLGWPPPTGTVTIKDGTKVIATGPLSGGTAAIPLPTLGAGSHGLTASYSGDSRTKAGTSAITTVTVNKATPTVTFTLSTSKPKVSSTKVKITVNLRIAGSSIRPANYVYIRLDGRTIKTMLISSAYAGTRSVSLPVFRKKGTFKLSVKYQGSSNVYSGTSSSKTITVR